MIAFEKHKRLKVLLTLKSLFEEKNTRFVKKIKSEESKKLKNGKNILLTKLKNNQNKTFAKNSFFTLKALLNFIQTLNWLLFYKSTKIED